MWIMASDKTGITPSKQISLLFFQSHKTYLRILSPQTNEVDPGVLLPKVLGDVDREVLDVGKTRNPLG